MMVEFWTSPWFGWAVAIAIGLPVLLVVLTELIAMFARRGSPAARPLRFLRNLVLPVGALLALLALADQSAAEFTWVRLVATLFGFLLILLVLSAFNAVLFGAPRVGTWRDRVPSIFVDITRLLLAVVGLAVLFSWVWDADVGGLFAALGVTSIVLGLALQGAIGSVVSGLLLLFEQPFRLGDWLETTTVRGRVVEVNWRSVHIETDDGVQIVPNATLAAASFTNLSRTVHGQFTASVTVAFAADDAPDEVMRLLRQVAGDVPQVVPGESISVMNEGTSGYTVTMPIVGPAMADAARNCFTTWLWYAAKRAGLALDGVRADPQNTDASVRAGLEAVSSALHLSDADVDTMAEACSIVRFAPGEVVQREGEVPREIRVILSGSADFTVLAGNGDVVPVAVFEHGDYLGQSALTRERALARVTARTPLTTVTVPADALDVLVGRKAQLAREISQTIERRRDAARAAARTADALRGSALPR